MKDYSNYHGTNTNEKISHDGLLLLEHSLNGFEGHDVVINSTINSKVLIYQKWDADSETKKVIGRIEDIDRGNVFRIGDLDWLVVTLPEDNKIYRKAEMRLCNSTFPIQSDKTQVLLVDENGNYILDDFGEPRISTSYSGNIELPCIAENKTTTSDTDKQLWIPENELQLIIPYHSSVKIGYKFKMYDDYFEVANIDRTKVINNKGVLTLRVRKGGGN